MVVGGTSAEMNLKTVKPASARYLDLFATGNERGHATRSSWRKNPRATRKRGIGVSSSAASTSVWTPALRFSSWGQLPIGIGVSRLLDRQAPAKSHPRAFSLRTLSATCPLLRN